MITMRRRVFLAVALSFVSVLAPAITAQDLPKRISDEAFWQMVSDFSEPGGYFRSDNFVSNETTFQYVIPALKKTTKTGGVYLGVGPDQNFTYIVALQPKIAFIVDIRRQNMLQHLMYKAIIEQSEDRADFLSHLFSRTRPPDVGVDSSPEELLQAFARIPSDPELYESNLSAIKDRLIRQHGFKLGPEDEEGIKYVYHAFQQAGPDINYSYFPSSNISADGNMPSYGDLMLQTDGQNENRNYIASEENFHILKDLQENNLIVPLVGDFGGNKTLLSVGQYIKDHNATLTALYTSNVEQYLFQSDAWMKFYPNVATFPIDSDSTFIRAVFNIPGSRARPNIRSTTLLCPIETQVQAFDEGRILSYRDVIRMSNLP